MTFKLNVERLMKAREASVTFVKMSDTARTVLALLKEASETPGFDGWVPSDAIVEGLCGDAVTPADPAHLTPAEVAMAEKWSKGRGRIRSALVYLSRVLRASMRSTRSARRSRWASRALVVPGCVSTT